ncbi:MAG: serpin family protein, partial [Planctomycetia bacterium]|nr:serpin family protein [Planctomycetia bacterium]
AFALLGGGTHLLWPTSQAADPGKVFQNVSLDSAQVKADRAALVQGNNQFAFDLYGRLRQEKGNLFLSPYSISTALGMTSAGARKDSLTQMEKTLRFPVEQTRLHPAFGALLRDTKAGKGYQLSVANALWCQVNYPFHDDFLKVNETYYGGKPTGLEFRKTEEARQTINTWVEKQTQDKIKELLKPNVLDADTRLVLTNAIYFKGDWADKFDKKLTQDQPFLTSSAKVPVPLMRRNGDYKYLDGGSFQALELPYANKELSMLVFLPKKVDGLAEFEQTLSAEKLQTWQGQMRQREVRVFLPRFKMTAEFKLNNVLQALGMSDVFDKGRSNLSGITNAEQLYITAAIHKAFVDVNEEGTEAAAATAVLIAPTSAPLVQPPPEFRADHPFFFVIRDNRSGSILFAGRLVEPEKSN